MTKTALAAAAAALAAALAVPTSALAQDMSSMMGGGNSCMMEQLQKLCGQPGSADFGSCAHAHAQEAAMACQGAQTHSKAYRKTAKQLKTKSPCMGEAEKYCPGKYPGTKAYSACMKAHESQLSPACVAFGKKRAHEGPAKMGACGADAEKLCPEDGPGSPKFMGCMMDHYADLSPACQAQFKNLKKRR